MPITSSIRYSLIDQVHRRHLWRYRNANNPEKAGEGGEAPRSQQRNACAPHLENQTQTAELCWHQRQCSIALM
jgi:hypothetical protein